MFYTRHSPCLVTSLLLLILTSTALASSLSSVIGTETLLASIANNTATNADNGQSLFSVSNSDKASALSTLNGFRSRAGASNMNYVCWEGNVADYAQSMASQCVDAYSALLPSDYDGTTYPAVYSIISTYASITSHTVSTALQYKYNQGPGTTSYNMVMMNDQSYFGCGQTFCSLYYVTGSGYQYNYYTTTCLHYYTSIPNLSRTPFTYGTACSACAYDRSCDGTLCRNYNSFKPALECNGSVTRCATSSVIATIVLGLALLHVYNHKQV